MILYNVDAVAHVETKTGTLIDDKDWQRWLANAAVFSDSKLRIRADNEYKNCKTRWGGSIVYYVLDKDLKQVRIGNAAAEYLLNADLAVTVTKVEISAMKRRHNRGI